WRRLRRLNQDASRKTWNVLPFLAGAVAGVGALLLHSLVDFNMHIPANAILAVVLLALLTSQWRFTTDRYWVSMTTAARLAASLLLLAGLVFFGFHGWRLAREDSCQRRANRETTLSAERLTALQQAFAIEPGNDETAYLIGEQYWWQVWQGDRHQLDYLHAAMDWFQRAAHLNPFAPESRLGMGACLDWLNRPDEAKRWFQEALVLDPNGLRTRALVGAHSFQAGDYALALHWLARALFLDPESSLARHYYFLALQKLEEEKKNQSTRK
ncbi:MAG: hypothetical protein NTW03_22955, partial [Verrucomicrobia bacterium]|nr:hypothetical protein [Verrucomicrobiota bacterium]